MFSPASSLPGLGHHDNDRAASSPKSMTPSFTRLIPSLSHTRQQYRIASPDESDLPSKGRLSRASKDIAFGSIAGTVAKIFEHPFDLIKVRLQTQPFTDPGPGGGQPRGTLYSGAFDAFRATIAKEGVIGLYRGLSMPVLGATLENASLFFTYNFVQGKIRQWNGTLQSQSGGPSSSSSSSSSSSLEMDSESPLSMPQLSIAAASAGAVASFVLTPIELIKCRMQVQMISKEASILAEEAAAKQKGIAPRYTMAEALSNARKSLPGAASLVKQTLQTQGIKGLWLGQTGTLLRETGGGMAWFLGFEATSRYFLSKVTNPKGNLPTKADLPSWQLILAGAMAGISYNVILFPADSVKSTIQTEMELAPKGTPPSSFITTAKRIWTTRGLKGLYAGCGITCLRSGPSSALIFLLYNRLEGWADNHGF
ncbi:unnamed protein product [Sympodiomycopsis kandeliae]